MRAILFDIDGTLVDSVDLHAEAWRDSLRDFGVEVPLARVREQIGKSGDLLMRALVPAARLAAIEDELAEHRAARFKAAFLPRVVGFPKVRELFQRLRDGGIGLALASSARGDELARYQEIAGVADLIDTATSADDVERGKPNPDIFQLARQRVGDPPPESCCVVGDSPYDAEAAGRAGLRAIGVLCGGFDPAVLRAAGHAALYRDPAELLERHQAIGDRLFFPTAA